MVSSRELARLDTVFLFLQTKSHDPFNRVHGIYNEVQDASFGRFGYIQASFRALGSSGFVVQIRLSC